MAGGVTAQYESEAVITRFEKISKNKVLFLDMDSGFKEHPEIVKNTPERSSPHRQQILCAQHSGLVRGSFIYVPKGVHVEMLRPTSESTPRTWASLSERSSSPMKAHRLLRRGHCTNILDGFLHSAVVELIAMEGAKFAILLYKIGLQTSTILSRSVVLLTRTPPLNGSMATLAQN